MAVTVIGDEALVAKLMRDRAELLAQKPYWLYHCGLLMHKEIGLDIARQGLFETGNLLRSGRVFNQTANGVSVGYGKGVPYAQALEHGSRPHPITATGIGGSVRHHTEGGSFNYSAPGGAPLLHFYWEKAGAWFVGPQVLHPGNKPYKYVYRGAMYSFQPIARYMFEKVMQLFGGA